MSRRPIPHPKQTNREIWCEELTCHLPSKPKFDTKHFCEWIPWRGVDSLTAWIPWRGGFLDGAFLCKGHILLGDYNFVKEFPFCKGAGSWRRAWGIIGHTCQSHLLLTHIKQESVWYDPWGSPGNPFGQVFDAIFKLWAFCPKFSDSDSMGFAEQHSLKWWTLLVLQLAGATFEIRFL